MNKESIFLKVHIVFALSLALVLLLFFIIYQIDNQTIKNSHITRAIDAFKSIYLLKNSENLNTILQNQGFDIIDKIPLKSELIEKRELSSGEFELFLFENTYYTKISIDNLLFLLKDMKKENSYIRYFVLLFGFVIFTLLFMYFLLLRSLKPLKKLQKAIIRYGEGDYDIDLNSSRKDEISIVANELTNATRHIKELQEARRLFLRNIMHELKTPITKGKICVNFLDDSENSKMLISIFYRLENLIKEMASIESLSSKSVNIEIKEYRIIDIVDNATELLYLNKGEIESIGVQNQRAKVDFNFFTIVIKNFIDNGLKYSIDQKIEIYINSKDLVFASKGERLKYELKIYLEPFFKEINSQSKDGFGLGLYIAYEILKLHKIGLTYKYDEKKERNLFVLENFIIK